MKKSTTSSLSLSYTAPTGNDLGQNRAVLYLEGPPLNVEAVCLTELVLHFPPGQTLKLSSATLGCVVDGEALLVHLPAEEAEFDLTVTAEPSGAVGVILLRTKRVRSKPDRPLRASFQ